MGDIAPSLATGGWSDSVALSIGNDTMQAMINGGNQGQPFNWKWNRINVKPFVTISLQQDYFVPGLVNLAWLESAWASNINQTSIPKQNTPVEVHKDLEVTYQQTGYPGKICWMPNNLLQTGTWGIAPLGPTSASNTGQTAVFGPNAGGLQNPGPNVIYTNPIGLLQTPVNATTCITDPNGNLWAMTTYGTCGTTQPTWPANPTFPTFANPTISASTVADGTCVWTAINPFGQGLRLSPIPPQSGIVWLIQPVGQMRAPRFTSLGQLLNPIPDDYEWAFKQGFFAQCYRRATDAKVRAKFTLENQLWMEALDKAVRQGDREMDDVGFYPGQSIMDTGYMITCVTPAMPFGPWNG